MTCSDLNTKIRSLRRFVNSLPFPLTIQHYYPPQNENFSGQRPILLTSADDWDRLRSVEESFFIPDDRGAWLQMCNSHIQHDSNAGDLPTRAVDVVRFMETRGMAPQIFSVGVGLAALEYHVKKSSPYIKVFCSDYTETTVARLKNCFIECDGVGFFDLRENEFKSVFPQATQDSLLLLHRVDPHLSDREWVGTFARLAHEGVDNILFVPHQVLNVRYLMFSKKREFVHRAIVRTPMVFSGFVRTFKRWLHLWRDHYYVREQLPIGYSEGFWLASRSSSNAATY